MQKTFFALLAIWLFAACHPATQPATIQANEAVQVDTFPGQCPYLTKDNSGHIVLSWVRMLPDSSSVFCYAVSTDEGKTFGPATVVPSSHNIEPHSENLPKIIFKPSGDIIALWGAANPNPKNKYSGLVYYAQSFNNGKTWTEPQPLVKDTAGYDQRYYDVALLPNGEASIIWLDNRKTTTKEGSAIYFASTHSRNGFEHEKQVGQFCCPCCRTDLFVDSKGGIHVLYRGIIQDSIRDMVHMVSTDGGKTFTPPNRINNDNWVIKGCPHTGPAMAENSDGLYFAWFTGGRDRGCFLTKSADNGKSFAPKDSISSAGAHPQLTALAGNDMAIVWDESVQVNNKFYKRIGVQKQTGDGTPEGKTYITADTATATYPVIASLKNNQSLVAYSLKKGDQSYVAYNVVTFGK